MFCTQCGSQMADDARFCASCGAKLGTVPQMVAVDVAELAPAAFAPASEQAPPPVHRATSAPEAKKVQLTAQEQELLIWEDGDTIEVVSGTISFTSKNRYQVVVSKVNPVYTQQVFFFDAHDQTWGSQEWWITMDNDMPNGPALLIVYRRGDKANAMGIVSMVNRSWAHAWPISHVKLIETSTRMKEVNRMESGTFVKALGGALVGSLLTGGLLAKQGAKVAAKGAIANQNANFDAITATLRSFMHRIAQSADQYWPAGGTAQSGRL